MKPRSEEVKEFDAAVGRRIEMTRKALGIAGVGLAQAAGISQQSLDSYESGRTSCPPIKLSKIASALGVSVAALVPKTTTCGFSGKSSRKRL
jgi:transcriptional regulator with XRE-family HTH domain